MECGSLDDHELAAQACEGREAAFRELLERYERPVFSLVVRMVRDRALAEDLVQEAFIRAFRGIRSFDPSYKFSSWLFRIASNVAIDHLRRRKLDTVSIHGADHRGHPDGRERPDLDLPARDQDPERFTENRELRERIEAALTHLRPEYRAVILLRHLEGHSYEEVAEILELPLGTVKTHLHRGRAELRELLREFER